MTWFAGGRTLGELSLPEPAHGISRFSLDARLAARFIAEGGALNTRHRATDQGDVEGRVLASGRRRTMESPWVGLKAHLRGVTLANDLELHLGAGAYVGLSRVEDGWVNVCGLFRRRAGLTGESSKAMARTLRGSGLEALAARIEHGEFRAGSASAVAGFTFDRRVAPSDGVWLGDSCAMVPPFTGNGMAMAFKGAELALEPLVGWATEGASWAETTKRVHAVLDAEFRMRLRGAHWLHRFLLGRRGQHCLGALARCGLLPMRPLYHVLH